MKKKSIGIIGGAGPSAGFFLGQKLIQIFQEKYHCIEDRDFPLIHIISYPFDDMLEPNANVKSIQNQLESIILHLEKIQIDLVAIACNTLHLFLSDNICQEKIVNILEETRNYVEQRDLQKILVLCTSTSRRENLHARYINNLVYPNKEEQKQIDTIIHQVMAGKVFSQKELQQMMEKILQNFPDIDALLLGCTELSLLSFSFLQKKGLIVIDPLQIIAEKLCYLSSVSYSKSQGITQSFSVIG